MEQVYLDAASVHTEVVRTLGLESRRLHIWLSRSTGGSTYEGSYITEDLPDRTKIEFGPDPIVFDYHGMRVLIHQYVRASDSASPGLNCPTCGELYSGRGGQTGLPVMLNCPNRHEWPDPRGGVNC